MDLSNLPEIMVEAIFFGDGVIKINYMESRDLSRAASLSKSITVDIEEVRDEFEELISNCQDIVDKGLLMLRNPPQRLGRKKDGEDDEPDDGG